MARAFCVMAGEGRPPTTFLCCTRQSRGWPASAGHDTRARGMWPRVNDNAGWYYKNPIDSHGTAATMTNATISAKIYGQIRHSASSGEMLPIAQAP